jgi:hypothetical protein
MQLRATVDIGLGTGIVHTWVIAGYESDDGDRVDLQIR